MHNIRKLKKKKKNQIPANPQDIAQQKLFQISNIHDYEFNMEFDQINFTEKQSPSQRYDNLKPIPNFPEKLSFINKNIKSVSFMNSKQREVKPCEQLRDFMSSMSMVRKQAHPPSELQKISSTNLSEGSAQRKPICLIKYLLVDNRDIKSKEQDKQRNKSLSYNFLKKKVFSRTHYQLKKPNYEYYGPNIYLTNQQGDLEDNKKSASSKQKRVDMILEIREEKRKELEKCKESKEIKDSKEKQASNIPFRKLHVSNMNKSLFYNPIQVKNIKLANKYPNNKTFFK